jgi:hypothetical protein
MLTILSITTPFWKVMCLLDCLVVRFATITYTIHTIFTGYSSPNLDDNHHETPSPVSAIPPVTERTVTAPAELKSCQDEFGAAMWVAERPSVLRLAQLIYKSKERSVSGECKNYTEEEEIPMTHGLNQNVSSGIQFSIRWEINIKL